MALEEAQTEDEILDSVEEVEEKPEPEQEENEVVETVEGEKEEPAPEEDIFENLEDEEKPLEDFEGAPESATLTLKQIKSQFPDAIKAFPVIKNALFKKEQYEEVFPTIQIAHEAAKRIGMYENLHRHIFEAGDLGPIISSMKSSNPDTLKRIAYKFSETLGDPGLANLAAEPVIRRHLKSMINESKATGNKNLELAARHTARYLYGTEDGSIPEGEFKLGKEVPPEVSEELKQLRAAREGIVNERFQGIQSNIINEIDSKVLNYIKSQIKSDDPNVKLNDFTREAAAKHAFGKVMEKLENNPAHIQRLRVLWNQLRADPSTAGDVGPRIIRAFLGSVKPYLPALVAEARSKAGLVSTTAAKKSDTSIVGGGGAVQKSTSTIPKGLKASDIDYSKTSEDDLLEGKITLRKRR